VGLFPFLDQGAPVGADRTSTASVTTAGLSVAATATETFAATADLTTAGLSATALVEEAFTADAALTTAGLSVARHRYAADVPRPRARPRLLRRALVRRRHGYGCTVAASQPGSGGVGLKYLDGKTIGAKPAKPRPSARPPVRAVARLDDGRARVCGSR
jgi:hypothetical protein